MQETPPEVNAGTYCREVESYLCRRNGGHLIRIVGPSFEMVRGWAEAGVPLSLVCRAIDVCSERRESRREAPRPLRVEFCEAEVRDQFQRWRRAVGPYVGAAGSAADAETEAASSPALAGHLTRAGEKLARAAARLERSDAFRGRLDAIVGEVARIQTESKGARGERRDAFVERLKQLDVELMAAAREEASRSALGEALRAAAAAELAPWRARMPAEAWTSAIAAASDRLLRDRLDLPDLAL
ncbi:MAG TPA: hypothetical protein VMN81_13875 [Vicinamibacterales bacterium]|nr:hypothetical protein [Vicinamibacterales bacterium]